MKNFRMTKLAAAIGVATMGLALAPSANAVVVVGGDNGWEVSFDGNVNLFYNQMHTDYYTHTAGGAKVAQAGYLGVAGSHDSAHLNEGLLPAFFSFNVKSPTVNGLTGTTRISFAPDSSSSKTSGNDKGGSAFSNSAIDMREVVANIDGSFGTISFGRTLGLFGRQAILNDQTLFGVGGVYVAGNFGGTTLGRIGYGYVYPEFRTRFSYKTPNINGFNLEVGLFDPQQPTSGGSWRTDVPKFEAEATYATTFTGGTANAYVDGTWQEMQFKGGDTVTSSGIDVGGKLTYMGFHVLGNYYTGDALGTDFKGTTGQGATGAAATGGGMVGLLGAPGWECTGSGANCRTATNDGWYAQGGYTFNGKTMVAGSYGESNQDSAAADANGLAFNKIEHSMWTVGVYHDLTPWLKLVAEYNNGEQRAHSPAGSETGLTQMNFDVWSVGAFMTW